MDPIDMVTQLEMQDALKLSGRINARVESIALWLLELKDDLADRPATLWRLTSFVYTEKYSAIPDREPQITARVQVGWDNRPITSKYGDPNDDEDESFHNSDYLYRVVVFPARYLWTTGWEHEQIEKAKEAANVLMCRRLKEWSEALAKHDERRSEILSKIEEYKNRAL